MTKLVLGPSFNGVDHSSETKQLSRDLDDLILDVLNGPKASNFRFTLIPQTYYSARVEEYPSLEDKLLESIPPSLVEGLFDSMSQSGSAWLSSNYFIKSDSSNRLLSFNYDKRFNRYEKSWEYTSSSTHVSPKRKAFIRFFDKHKRDSEPDWVTGLRCEEKELDSFIRNASPEEIFGEEAFNPPSIEAGELVTEVWEVVSEIYEEHLRKERGLFKWFADTELVAKQNKALKSLIEDKVVERLLSEALDYWTEEELMPLSSQPLVVSSGYTELQDLSLEEFDEMLEEVFSGLVRLQTIKRFPDLGG